MWPGHQPNLQQSNSIIQIPSYMYLFMHCRMIGLRYLWSLCYDEEMEINTTLIRSYGFNLLAGIGYGTYLSVDFALLLDILPSHRDKAKDIAIWNQVCILPDANITDRTNFSSHRWLSSHHFHFSSLSLLLYAFPSRVTRSLSVKFLPLFYWWSSERTGWGFTVVSSLTLLH